jgi:hypothetical protein
MDQTAASDPSEETTAMEPIALVPFTGHSGNLQTTVPMHTSGKPGDPLADVLLSMDDEDDVGEMTTMFMVGKTGTDSEEMQIGMITQLPDQPSTQLSPLLSSQLSLKEDVKTTTMTSLNQGILSTNDSATSTAMYPLSSLFAAVTQKPTTVKEMTTTAKLPTTTATAQQTTTAKETSPLSLGSFYPQHAAWEVDDDPQSFHDQTKPTVNAGVGKATDRPLAGGQTKAESEAEIRTKLEELLDHNTRLVDLLRTSLQLQYSLFSRIFRTILP